jgi:drug/metabolite transporter (DMT)-like permease
MIESFTQSACFLMNEILSYLIVSILWGFTNPFIKLGTNGLEHVQQKHQKYTKLYELKFLLTRWQYMLPQLLNLSGSLVFYYLLGNSDISRVVPITNALTFVTTFIASWLLGERITKRYFFGMAFIITGVLLCVE